MGGPIIRCHLVTTYNIPRDQRTLPPISTVVLEVKGVSPDMAWRVRKSNSPRRR